MFMTCHKMLRVPRNLHLVSNSRSADIAIRKKKNTQHDTSEVLRLPRKLTMELPAPMREGLVQGICQS